MASKPFSEMDRSSWQKISKGIVELQTKTNQTKTLALNAAGFNLDPYLIPTLKLLAYYSNTISCLGKKENLCMMLLLSNDKFIKIMVLCF